MILATFQGVILREIFVKSPASTNGETLGETYDSVRNEPALDYMADCVLGPIHPARAL